MIQNPFRTINDIQEQCDSERGAALAYVGAAALAVEAAPLAANLVTRNIYTKLATGFLGGTLLPYEVFINKEHIAGSFNEAIEDLRGENIYYVPRFGLSVEEEYGQMFSVDNGNYLVNVEEAKESNLRKIDGSHTIINAGFWKFINPQRMIVTQDSLDSDVWMDIASRVDNDVYSQLEVEVMQRVTTSISNQIEYDYDNYYNPDENIFVVDYDGKNEMLKNILNFAIKKDSSLEYLFEKERTVCFEKAIAEYIYLETQGIESSIVGTTDHAFLIYGENNDIFIADPTVPSGLVMSLDDSGYSALYDDFKILDSIFEPILK